MQGLRVLEYACDVTIDETGQPLEIWSIIFNEVCKKPGMYVLSRFAYALRKSILALTTAPAFLHWPLLPFLRYASVLALQNRWTCGIPFQSYHTLFEGHGGGGYFPVQCQLFEMGLLATGGHCC